MTTTWSARAACHGLDPRMFFPATEEESGPAKDVCAGCEVQYECLEHALGTRERQGVWGGCTERERRRIVRRRRRLAS